MLKVKIPKIVLMALTLVFCLHLTGLTVADECWKSKGDGPTVPGNYTYPPEWHPAFQYDPNNPDEIDRNSSVEISVIRGTPPYTWSVSGNGFSLSLDETEGLSNALYANDTACGTATITVIDNYGVPVAGYVRCTEGHWVENCTETAEDWWGTCCVKTSTYIHPYKHYAIWQCNEFGHPGAEVLCGFNYMDGGGCYYRGWNTLRYVTRYKWDCSE